MQRRISGMALMMAASMCLAIGGVPQVTRSFSSETVGPEGALLVTLEVVFPLGEACPHVCLLEESWPPGWQIGEATWNGLPIRSVQLPGETVWCWLFGEADTAPVGDGNLTYRLTAPEKLSSRMSMNHADGAVYSFDSQACIGGTEELLMDEAAQPACFTMSFPPGWSLLALPFTPNAESRETLEALHAGLFTLADDQANSHRDTLPVMGRPFWLFNPANQKIECSLTADVVVDNTAEPLCPAGTIVRHGWNLFGVCGSDPVRLADGVAAFRWLDGHYEHCPPNAVLQPGEAAWIRVE